MGQLKCEICGSSDLIKADGVFQCRSCGMQYSLDEIRKMLGAAPASSDAVPAPVNTVPQETEADKYLRFARIAKSKEDWGESERYYKMLEMENPDNIEASFYGSYGKAKKSLVENNLYERQAIFKVLQNSVAMIPSKYRIERAEEDNEIILQISNDILDLASSNYVYNYTKNGYGIVVSSEKMSTVTLFNNISFEFCNTCEKIIAKLPPEMEESKLAMYRIALRQSEYVLENGSLESPAAFTAKKNSYSSYLLNALCNKNKDNPAIKFLEANRIQIGRFNNIPLTWTVIALNDNSVKMICDTCVIKGMISSELKNFNFDNSSLNKWLNNDFLNYAFTPAEKPLIKAPSAAFAVSIPTRNEVESSTISRIAYQHGTQTPVWWWTKTQALAGLLSSGAAMDYDPYGKLNLKGHALNDQRIGIRPSIWITFN